MKRYFANLTFPYNSNLFFCTIGIPFFPKKRLLPFKIEYFLND